MKEIKVKIISQNQDVGGLCRIEVKPLDKIYGPLNCGKTYKLVEDEPTKTAYTKMTYPIGDIRIPLDFYKLIEERISGNHNTRVNKFKTAKLIKPVKRVMFNGNATILEIGDFKTVVKCDEEDEFDEIIGLGLALSRYYTKHRATRKEMETLKYCFHPQYEDLAAYCIHKYFEYDEKCILDFFNKIEKGKWIDL